MCVCMIWDADKVCTLTRTLGQVQTKGSHEALLWEGELVRAPIRGSVGGVELLNGLYHVTTESMSGSIIWLCSRSVQSCLYYGSMYSSYIKFRGLNWNSLQLPLNNYNHIFMKHQIIITSSPKIIYYVYYYSSMYSRIRHLEDFKLKVPGLAVLWSSMQMIKFWWGELTYVLCTSSEYSGSGIMQRSIVSIGQAPATWCSSIHIVHTVQLKSLKLPPTPNNNPHDCGRACS